MADIGDDELSLIFAQISDPVDRSSISLVRKQWQRVEGLTRSSLRVIEPHLMPSFLPRFPNLTTFGCSTVIADAHIELLAKICPKLETLILNRHQRGYLPDELVENLMFPDFSDVGLCAIAKWCPNLSRVSLRSRKGVGDLGVIQLVKGLGNLTSLDLTRCSQVTDQSLAFLGKAGRLRSLHLDGCILITDNGLINLASGPLLKTLKKLVLCECDRITDLGVTALRSMCSLEELDLADCGPGITDLGGVAISCIKSLRRLDLSWLINIGDTTLEMLAGNCKSLAEAVIVGCEEVTGNGIRSFASHSSLETLLMSSCDQILSDDVVYLVSSCQSLRCIQLDRRLRSFMPMMLQADISALCHINWI